MPRLHESVRNLFRDRNDPSKPASSTWESMRHLHKNTTSVFVPLHKKVEKFTDKVGDKVGKPVGSLLFMAYKVLPLTIFLLCTPTWVVSFAYVSFFLITKVTVVVSPESYEKNMKQFGGPISVATRYFAIYAGIQSVLFVVTMSFVKTDPYLNLVYAAIFAMATIDLTKTYVELKKRMNGEIPSKIAATISSGGVHTPSPLKNHATPHSDTSTDSDASPAPSPEVRRRKFSLKGKDDESAPRLGSVQEERVVESESDDGEGDEDSGRPTKSVSFDRQAHNASEASPASAESTPAKESLPNSPADDKIVPIAAAQIQLDTNVTVRANGTDELGVDKTATLP